MFLIWHCRLIVFIQKNYSIVMNVLFYAFQEYMNIFEIQRGTCNLEYFFVRLSLFPIHRRSRSGTVCINSSHRDPAFSL